MRNSFFFITKVFLIFFSILFLHTSINAQPSRSIAKGKIFALIIGISEYQDDNIKDLSFAHRDAELFKDYLTSPAGGSVPDDQIKLLTNQQATISNIYVAKKWLETKAQKDDLVIFYFSGHGDVESSLYKLGFLLAYDTPHKNYLNNAVRIEDFNIMANTLSIEKKADVILITDACHSGKLAGSDNRGRALVGEQLSIVEKNEIRIASCESEQLSQEDVAWGGGRGVFSYYLLNGLKGMADADDEDGIVTLNELKTYLEKNVQKDVFKLKNEEQIPVVNGRGFSAMAIVDDATLNELKNNTSNTSALVSNSQPRSISNKLTIEDHYFNQLSANNLKQALDFEELAYKPANEVIKLMLSNKTLITNDSIDYTEWLHKVSTQADLKSEYQQKLASSIHNNVQQAINAYLIANADELEKRQYYNAEKHPFGAYDAMLKTAMVLIDSTNHLHHMMKVKQYYFKGVDARLKMVYTANQDSLLDIALKYQNLALSLEARAAYIHNELGILNKMKHKNSDTSFYFYKEAEKHFNKAIELVPTWALPYSNLSSLYYRWAKYDEGLQSGKKAIALQPDYMMGYTNLGRNAQMVKNYLVAEENYLRALKINNKHFLPHELLGNLYLETTQYNKADSFYYESDLRIHGLDFSLGILPIEMDSDGVIDMLDKEPNTLTECVIDESEVGERDFMVLFYKGLMAFRKNKLNDAYIYFSKVINISPEDPIAYKYLGDIVYQQQNWLQAEVYYQLAQQHYLDSLDFEAYVIKSLASHQYKGCNIDDIYKKAYYDLSLIHYILGDIYTEWGYYYKAEKLYRELLAIDKNNIIHYYLLWNLYEIQGQFEKVEKTIVSLQAVDKYQSENELFAFHNRQIERKIDVSINEYKAGLILYNRLKENKKEFSVFGAYEDQDNFVNDWFEDPIIPGTTKKYQKAGIPSNLTIQSVRYLESSSESIKKQSILADIHLRLGDLYFYIGDANKSKSNYQIASDILEKDAYTKEKYIELSIKENQFSDAYAYLDKMYHSNQLNYTTLKYYTEYSLHSNALNRADSLLTWVHDSYPFPTKKMKYLEAKSHVFNKRYDKAISSYEAYSKMFADNDGSGNYTIARIYALQNDKKQSLNYLEKAMSSGFNYAYVLDKDEVFDFVRDSPKWKKLKQKVNPKFSIPSEN